jgi:hypothetical protein
MRNGKEVLVLIILIFVVLVSAAKAEVDSQAVGFNLQSQTAALEQSVAADESRIFTIIDRDYTADSSVKIGVDSTSSTLSHPDGYGLIVTLTALF